MIFKIHGTISTYLHFKLCNMLILGRDQVGLFHHTTQEPNFLRNITSATMPFVMTFAINTTKKNGVLISNNKDGWKIRHDPQPTQNQAFQQYKEQIEHYCICQMWSHSACTPSDRNHFTGSHACLN